MIRIRKAAFPFEGFGTSFLPATKAMPKRFLPTVDKPSIHYAVEEDITAEIDTLILVTGRNKRAIEDHFDTNNGLEAMLRARGKDAQTASSHDIFQQVSNAFLYILPNSWCWAILAVRQKQMVGSAGNMPI